MPVSGTYVGSWTDPDVAGLAAAVGATVGADAGALVGGAGAAVGFADAAVGGAAAGCVGAGGELVAHAAARAAVPTPSEDRRNVRRLITMTPPLTNL